MKPHLLFLAILMTIVDGFAQPQLLKDINPGANGSYVVADNAGKQVGNLFYFVATTPDSGAELWKTDGTEAGTAIVKDILAGTSGSQPNNFYVLDSILLFTAEDGVNGRELWRSNGTEAGTFLARDVYIGANTGISDKIGNPNYFIVYNGLLFFNGEKSGSGKELWKSDGTSGGTNQVKDIYFGASGSNPSNFEVNNGILYFAATTSANGRELWKTDGTAAGTIIVKDINPTGFGSSPSDFRSIGSTLLFIADDGVHSEELWKTDGTSAGTVLVKDIKTNTTGTFTASGFETQPNSFENRFARVGDIAFFSAIDDAGDIELWKTDGTEAGTVLVKNASNDESTPQNFAVLGNEVFYKYQDELWKSDGTAAGTNLVKDIAPVFGSLSLPTWIYPHNGKIYLGADDGSKGTELWESDGSENGTVLLKDIRSGFNSSDPSNFASFGKRLIFWADNGATGSEIWSYLPPIQVTATTTNILCKGDSTGTISLTTSGTAPFSYTWTPSWVSGENPNGLPAGSYSATVTDADGASAQTTIIIHEPAAALNLNIASTPTSGTAANGSATATVSGGTGPYNYLWNTNPPQSTATATNLPSGDWACSVTDNNGCVVSSTASVGVIIQATTTIFDVFCKGDSTGAIFVESNGFAPFSATWLPNWVTSLTPQNLPVGNFTVTVTDANGNTAIATATIAEPTNALSVTTTSTPTVIMMSNGTATAEPAGGTPPYQYLWNTVPVQSTKSATSLSAGTYQVTVSDSLGCTFIASVVVNAVVSTNEVKTDLAKISPNPTNGWVEILNPEIFSNIQTIEVVDMLGRVIRKESVDETGLNNPFFVSEISGIYQLVGYGPFLGARVLGKVVVE